MRPDRWSDLVTQMYTLVHEQAALAELPHEVRDLQGDGTVVVHGPWDPAECRSVLVPWLRTGWIELIADAAAPGSYVVLADAEAVPLLDDTSRWLPGTEDGRVMLALTDEGERHEYDAWLALAGARP